jgi:hypothetical protein
MLRASARGGYPQLFPVPAFVADRLGLLMRVHPSTWRSVVYVGLNARGSFLPVGTGFCTGTRYRDHAFFNFVTADHVVDLVSGDTIYIRMNTKSGEAGAPIPIPKAARFPGIDRRLDLAIFPVPSLHEGYDADYVFLDRGEYNSILEEVWRPHLGDEVATIGLYTSHHGHTKNIPVVRVGNDLHGRRPGIFGSVGIGAGAVIGRVQRQRFGVRQRRDGKKQQRKDRPHHGSHPLSIKTSNIAPHFTNVGGMVRRFTQRSQSKPIPPLKILFYVDEKRFSEGRLSAGNRQSISSRARPGGARPH